MQSERRERASTLRQDIRSQWERMGSLLEEILRRDPLVKGTLYERRRRCGRAGCRCERGELHVSEAFSSSDGGRTRHVSLDGVDRKRLAQCVDRYRRFRSARAELCKASRALTALVDALESARRIGLEDLNGKRRPGGIAEGSSV
jgi:hypothetical protein